jgi:cell division protein FtsI (penicillin-binding protein 3)
VKKHDTKRILKVRYWSCYIGFHLLVVSCLSAILFKAFCLQVIEHPTWVERSRAQTETVLQIPSYRGSIYDREGRLLSYSVPQQSLFADCDQIENPKEVAQKLTSILGEPESGLEKKLSMKRRFVWIKRLLTDQQAAAVDCLNIRGLTLVSEFKRFYPYRQVAGQVLGFVGLDGAGLEGVEKSFDHVLRQTEKKVGQQRDGIRRCLWLRPSAPPEPDESHGVKLTLDVFLQYLCEVELEKAALQYKAKAAEIVIFDPQTSEVLAMANWPFFDPNLADKKHPGAWRNRVITDSFEPGSTFKVFLVGAALEEGVTKERDRIFCENGKCRLAGHTINDTHPYGWLTIPEVVKYSSNIASSKIALQLGNDRYHRYIQAFGFGAPTGISLPGEVKGLVRSPKKWRPIDLATTGFGQSIGVTALQLNGAIAAIANAGVYSQPLIAKEILSSSGETVESFQPVSLRRVLRDKTANQLSAMMHGVTLEGGTGVSAVPEGYTAAGKTGTAQLLDPETRRYASNKYTSLFTGFVPAENPRLVITVVVHEPKGAIYGGVVAAPVFRNIAARALPYLGVMPSVIKEVPAPGLRSVKASPNTIQKNPPSAQKKKDTGVPKPSETPVTVRAATKKGSPGPHSAGPVRELNRRPSPIYTVKTDSRMGIGVD